MAKNAFRDFAIFFPHIRWNQKHCG